MSLFVITLIWPAQTSCYCGIYSLETIWQTERWL